MRLPRRPKPPFDRPPHPPLPPHYLFWHRHHHHHPHHRQFLQQYQYFRYLRPIVILLTLAILYWAFSWAGSKELGLLFVGLLAFKEVLHFFFLWRLERNIFKPMLLLKQGLDEVAQGNYQYKVSNELPGDLGLVIDAFNTMTEKLAESERLQSEYEENRKTLVANISHDLKTPITAIQGYVEALLETPALDAGNREKYLSTIQQNTQYVNRLIDDLFLFAKLDMQKLEFHFQPTDISAYLADVADEFQFDCSERSVQFAYTDALCARSLVLLDGKRFYQALRNIFNNALQHAPAATLRIQLRLCQQDAQVHIDIADNGPGIPADKLPFIFDRFYRIDSERPKDSGGTGLGLSIAGELIAAHQGNITVRSAAETGTVFTITLPVWRSPDREDE